MSARRNGGVFTSAASLRLLVFLLLSFSFFYMGFLASEVRSTSSARKAAMYASLFSSSSFSSKSSASSTSASSTSASSSSCSPPRNWRLGVCEWPDSPKRMQRGTMGPDMARLLNATVVDSGPGGLANSPDLHLCLGWFYDARLKEERSNRVKQATQFTSNTREIEGALIWPPRTAILPHLPNASFRIAFSDEVFDSGDCSMYDVLVVVSKKGNFHGCPLIYMPSAVSEMYHRPKRRHADLILPPDFNVSAKLAEKTEFAVFLYTSCFKKIYHGRDFMLRTIFYELLSEEYKQVTPLGDCRSKGPRLVPQKEDHHEDMPADIYKPFKFVIAFENTEVDGYVTEKVTNGVLSYSVPIYFGPSDVGDLINTNRVIECKPNAEILKEYRAEPHINTPAEFEAQVVIWKERLRDAFQPCIAQVKELDQDDEKYKAKVSQWMLPNNRVAGSIWDLKHLLHHLNLVWKRVGSRLYDPCYELPS